MARFLWVKAGAITNIVDYGTATPPDIENGNDVVPEVTGLEFVGQAIDITDTLKTRYINRMDQVALQELFRLTNQTRVLSLLSPLTLDQYKATLKAMIVVAVQV
jgi:hypothetical protein